MTTSDLSPREAIDLFRAERLNGMYLLRIFSAWPRWTVPGDEVESQLILRPIAGGDGEPQLVMFSDEAAVAAAQAYLGAETPNEPLITASGDAVFAALSDDFATVRINPFAGSDLYYAREQFPRLREWGQIAAVERALANVLRTGAGLDTIRNFDGYYIAVNREGLQNIALVPDDFGRRLAAIFTARDALEAYLDENGGPDTQSLGMTGVQLFTALRKIPLDGIVFNPEGPAAYGFATAFVELLMRNSGTSTDLFAS
jgi:hypothetical protein